MSTLKTNNIEHLDASTPSIQTTIGGGTILAGVSTARNDLFFGANEKAKLFENGNQSGIQVVNSGSSAHLMTHDGNEDIHVDPSGYIRFEVAGSERLRITSDGKIGINQTSPSEKLEVYAGDILLSSNANGVSGGIGPNAALKFEYNGHQYAKIVGNGRDSSGYGDIDFYTSSSAGVSNLTQRMTIRSDGTVGIGTDNPTKALQISQNSDCAIRIDANNSNANARTWEIIVGGNPSNNAEMVFRTRQDDGTGGSECVRFTRSGVIKLPDGGGVDFSATGDASGMTSELLDDYEEGTWTPNITSSGYTLTTTSGYYTKIGNLVSVHFQVKFSAIGSNNASAAFNGLPFNSNSAFHHAGVCRETTAYGDIFVAQVTAGNANVAINSMDGVVNGDNAIFETARNYNAQITYFV
jgi:hypothetical protein